MENNLEITIRPLTDWRLVKELALATIGKKVVNDPDDAWKRKMLKSEHSPNYNLWFKVDIPSYVSVHFARHHEGFVPYVKTQREDRTGIPREERKQTELVDMTIVLNSMAFINVSKKRLCGMADKNTRAVWTAVVNKLKEVDPIVAEFCVPSCVYRNGCPEFKPCGYFKAYKELHKFDRES